MDLLGTYRAVRGQTVALARPLSAEDQMVQSMPDASPTKWHLGHSSWFFETFVLGPHLSHYRPVDARYRSLFNSYYERLGAGVRPERARRGTLSRPSLSEVLAYRRAVDDAVARLLESGDVAAAVAAAVQLGLHHEQQHQELILTDLKHAFGSQPLRPPYLAPASSPAGALAATPVLPPPSFRIFPEGLADIGHQGPGFAFDNETPRHRRFLRGFALCDRPVTCGEYLAFMRDGGYRRPELWLSDGWALARAEGWSAPLYWQVDDGAWQAYTLAGMQPVVPDEALAHVSYYEADAFARWAGARLPTEDEWERAAAGAPVVGHFADAGRLHPGVAGAAGRLFGDVWQWTASPYTPYPGYVAPPGPIGEYNGKFMSNQMVLRGGSCLTPAGHVRATYRNFFPPGVRWQMAGLRLARDA